MKINAKIVADSCNEFGKRITTMEVVMPRFILAEFNTHRMLSKNSASSRAIPFEKMLKMVQETPFIPIAWQKDHKGMQGTNYITNEKDLASCEYEWLKARDYAVKQASVLNQDFGSGGVTKQLCNRLLEPYMYHKVLVTATEWENFFALRCPKYKGYFPESMEDKNYFRSKKDFCKMFHEGKMSQWDNLTWLKINTGQAEIHMMELAECIWDAMNESTPKMLLPGEWHIPFGNDIKLGDAEPLGYNIEKWIKVSTARCARVSYTVVGEEDKPANYENDIKLHDRLLDSGHMSPFEHCAQNNTQELIDLHRDLWSGNFFGFTQYRKGLVGENITKNIK